MSADVKRYSRKFLNPIKHWDTGIVQWDVEQTNNSIDASFSIWDCSKKIVLDFNCYNTYDMKVRAEKLDLLVKELLKFKEAMADAASNSIIHYEDEDDS